MLRTRAIAVVTLMAVCASSYTVISCVGWQATAALRSACCNTAGHACAGADADNCCAKGEQQRQASSEKAAVAVVAPVLPIAALLTPRPRTAVLLDRHLPEPRPHVPTHVLLSVFLV